MLVFSLSYKFNDASPNVSRAIKFIKNGSSFLCTVTMSHKNIPLMKNVLNSSYLYLFKFKEKIEIEKYESFIFLKGGD